MNRFAALLDRLAYETRRNAKIRLLADYFRHTPDPDRGFALAAMTGALNFKEAKPNVIRGLVEERVDPCFFGCPTTMSATLPRRRRSSGPLRHRAAASQRRTFRPSRRSSPPSPRSARATCRHRSPDWLDALDETGRWALLKLITRELRIGVSARLAKTAVAELGGVTPDEVELIWHGLAPPYEDLFAWVEGKGEKPESGNPAPFRPPMLSHPLEEEDLLKARSRRLRGGVEMGRHPTAGRRRSHLGRQARPAHLSRTGEDASRAFPDLVEALDFEGAIDGELLIVREGRVQSFNVLQQRLNCKAVTPKLVAAFPAHLRVYDILSEGAQDLREVPFLERRKRLEALVRRLGDPRIDLSPLVPFSNWQDLAAARSDPASVGAGPDADAIEGCMVKRADSPYLPGRPKGYWYKWKRDPYLVDAVMMYAQRGHGKRSSYYSDYTFGVWRTTAAGAELVPVGKAYFGFTDEELLKLDRYVRNHTANRFGPVRELEYGAGKGLVLEVAFEGLQRSSRHKSGVAMRFPRINRIRWDKPAAEADRIESLEKILARGETEVFPMRANAPQDGA